MTAARTESARRRGAVLFEVLLSIALFVGAAAFALGATRTVLTAFDRSGRAALALDLARAKMAELEAGLVTIAELRESAEGIDRVGSIDPFGEDASATPGRGATRWIISLRTERTEFTGLSLVELTVEEETDASAPSDETPVTATLRQLVRLREEEAEAYEADEMLRGLPLVPPGGAE